MYSRYSISVKDLKSIRYTACVSVYSTDIPYFLDWNARVLLVPSELLAGVVFEGAFYSRARSIPFSLSVTKFFSKHKKPWTISLHNHTILIHHKQNYFIQHTNVTFMN